MQWCEHSEYTNITTDWYSIEHCKVANYICMKPSSPLLVCDRLDVLSIIVTIEI